MSSIVVSGDTSGAVTLSAPAVAGTVTVTLPSASGTMASLASVTANGVAYVNSSGQPTSGTALAFNGSKLGIGVTSFDVPLQVQAITGGLSMRLNGRASPNDGYSDIGFYNSANTTQHAGIGAATSGLILATNISAPIQFQTNNAEVGRFDASGNLLVGTTSKLAGGIVGLDINTSAATGITFAKSGTNKAYFYLLTDASAFQWQTASGTAASVVSSTNGVTLSNGATSWASLSDERKKDIIEPITDAATKVSSLRAVIGKYKTEEDGIRRAMLIAQDVQAVLPEAVVENKDGELLLQYTEIIPLLVAAIKEQSALITQLQADVAALKGAA